MSRSRMGPDAARSRASGPTDGSDAGFSESIAHRDQSGHESDPPSPASRERGQAA
jgi:hypothetical protein